WKGEWIMGEAIVITSGKGGVGKTTTSANLGTALALNEKSVCLIDTDIGLRNLDVIMGLENRIIYDIVDVIEERCQLKQALIMKIIAELKEEYDYIIIDCPAGIEQGFQNALAGADKAIVVTTPEKSSVRDADRIVGLIEQHEIDSPTLVINRIRNHMMQDGEM